MRMYVVSYSIADDQVRAGLEKILFESPGWCSYFPGTWIIVTAEAPHALTARVKDFLAAADRLLIMEVKPNGQYSGWLPEDAWKWVQTAGTLISQQ